LFLSRKEHNSAPCAVITAVSSDDSRQYLSIP
jgi:hypothetical protein